MNVPTTGISCERMPADTPKAIGEGNPIKRKATERIKLAKMPNINFATIKPAAFETPTFQTSSMIFQKEWERLFLRAERHLFPSLIK